MCPGLTSPGAKLYPAAVDTIVVSFPGSGEKCVHCILVITERTNIQESIRCIFWKLLLCYIFLLTFEDRGSNIILC